MIIVLTMCTICKVPQVADNYELICEEALSRAAHRQPLRYRPLHIATS